MTSYGEGVNSGEGGRWAREPACFEALGRLAGQVAERVERLFAIVRSQAELLGDGEPSRGILEAAERGLSLSAGLRALGRRESSAGALVDLSGIVEGLRGDLESLAGDDVALELRLADGPVPASVDHREIESVIMSLVENARQAMPRGGTLILETARVSIPDPDGEPEAPPIPQDNYVRIAVRDTGAGMAPDVLDRIFEPLFTTREAAGAAGLGLSIAYGVVKQSGGHLAARSRAGRGTSFEIYLPRAKEPEPVASEAHPLSELGGSETILLVERDALLRQSAVLSLERAGYRVIAASDLERALRAGKREPGPLHLLIVDAVTPEGSGAELVGELRRTHPSVRALYMFEELGEGTPYLTKPFSPASLLEAVRTALDQDEG